MVKKSIAIVLVACIFSSGCTYRSTLRKDFYKTPSQEKAALPGRVSVITAKKSSEIYYKEFLCDTYVHLDPNEGLFNAIKTELSGLYKDVSLAPKSSPIKNDLEVHARLSDRNRGSAEMLAMDFVDPEFGETLASYESGLSSYRINCGMGTYWGAYALSMFLLYPLRIVATKSTGAKAKKAVEKSVGNSVRAIGALAAKKKELAQYPLNKSHAVAAEKEGDAALSQGKDLVAFNAYRKALDHTWVGYGLDWRIRKKFLPLVPKHAPNAPIPETARKRFQQGKFIAQTGKPGRLGEAVTALYDAIKLAPAWTDAYWQLSKVLEAERTYSKASKALELYLLGKPSLPDREAVQQRVYELAALKDGELQPIEQVQPAPSKTDVQPDPVSISAADIDSPRYSSVSKPHHYAIVIGIEDYSSIPKAEFAQHDAEAVKKHLIASGYPETNIITLIGQKATRAAIGGYVEEWLPKNITPSSSLLFYYSGHGAPDAETGQAYLLPWDGNPQFLKSTAYPLQRLYASLGKLKARNKLVALDSCFSGAGGRSVLARGTRPLVTKIEALTPAKESMAVLAAASGDQITSTLPDKKHGIFTYYFLAGLSGAAQNAAGKVTLRGLYDYLKPNVETAAHRQNREQSPVLHVDSDAHFLLR